MGNEKYGFVYLWRDKKHNRYYVGCHWGREDDGYICSSKWMRHARERRPEDFKRRILSKNHQTKEEMFNEETRILGMIKKEEIKQKYYNLNIGSTYHWAAKQYNPDELTPAQKSGNTRKGVSVGPCSEGRARRISEGKKLKFEERRRLTGSATTEEWRERNRQARLGSRRTEEAKKKTSEGLLKFYNENPEEKIKITERQRGRRRMFKYCGICGIDTGNPRSNFCKKHHHTAIGLSRKRSGNGRGWKHSEESKRRISQNTKIALAAS